jgi:hypothetical protein
MQTSGVQRTVNGSLGLDVKVRRVLKLLEIPWSPFDAIAESFEVFQRSSSQLKELMF